MESKEGFRLQIIKPDNIQMYHMIIYDTFITLRKSTKTISKDLLIV